MKKVKNLITGRLAATVALMSLFAVCFLSATMPLRSWGANKKVIEKGIPSMAFIGLVATFKKNKSWETMDENSQKFAEGMDVVLKELATNAITEAQMTEKLTEFEKKHEKGLLDEEKQKSFKETVDAVKGLALEIQKLKDQGFTAQVVLPFDQAFMKSYNEKKEEIAKIKGNEKASVTLNFKAAAVMGLGNVSNTEAPTIPGTTAITGLAETPRNQPFLIDLVDASSISTPTIIWYNKINREDGTAFIAEGDLKPLSDFDIEGETQSVKKVATRFNISEEMLTDIPFIEGEIRNEGVANLRLKIDEAILSGDGTGNNLKGILEYVSGYALASLNDSTPGANEYDAILAAHTMLNTLNYMPNAILVHPTTRYKLRTLKDKNNNYIIPPSQDNNALNIDGLPVIAKNQIEAGKILMGDFKKSHVRTLMDINVRVGYNDDDFAKNRVTFLVEARLMHFIKDVETSAFVYDDLSVIMAALEDAAAE